MVGWGIRPTGLSDPKWAFWQEPFCVSKAGLGPASPLLAFQTKYIPTAGNAADGVITGIEPWLHIYKPYKATYSPYNWSWLVNRGCTSKCHTCSWAGASSLSHQPVSLLVRLCLLCRVRRRDHSCRSRIESLRKSWYSKCKTCDLFIKHYKTMFMCFFLRAERHHVFFAFLPAVFGSPT